MTKSEQYVKYEKSFAYPGLHCAMIFHYDPIFEVVECRSIYSEARTEVVMWMEQQMKYYRNNKIDATAYIDGVFEEAIGEVYKYLEDDDSYDKED